MTGAITGAIAGKVVVLAAGLIAPVTSSLVGARWSDGIVKGDRPRISDAVSLVDVATSVNGQAIATI